MIAICIIKSRSVWGLSRMVARKGLGWKSIYLSPKCFLLPWLTFAIKPSVKDGGLSWMIAKMCDVYVCFIKWRLSRVFHELSRGSMEDKFYLLIPCHSILLFKCLLYPALSQTDRSFMNDRKKWLWQKCIKLFRTLFYTFMISCPKSRSQVVRELSQYSVKYIISLACSTIKCFQFHFETTA